MKLKLVILLLLAPALLYGQIKPLNFKAGNTLLPLSIDAQANLKKHDFSNIWMQTDNSVIFGFIGTNHQRIRIKFLKVTKDNLRPEIYHVSGKSMVKGNICDFSGTIKISNIQRYKKTSVGLDGEYKNKVAGEYSLTGAYIFNENKTQSHVGVFKGIFQSDIYIDKKNGIHYDDLDKVSDSYSNNQFVGSWTSYDHKITKLCNWGDYRIPNAGGFDSGEGEFNPNTKDASLGWQTYIDMGKSEKAKKEEERHWWN